MRNGATNQQPQCDKHTRSSETWEISFFLGMCTAAVFWTSDTSKEKATSKTDERSMMAMSDKDEDDGVKAG